MSRTVARLPAGSRITDYISLGVVAKTFGLAKTIEHWPELAPRLAEPKRKRKRHSLS
jgi:hypothetical protein